MPVCHLNWSTANKKEKGIIKKQARFVPSRNIISTNATFALNNAIPLSTIFMQNSIINFHNTNDKKSKLTWTEFGWAL